jgi:putative Holliday junction resolvase
MTIGLLKNISGECPKNVALLGLDVGKKTIGLALSDPAQSLAVPLQTIKRTKFTADIAVLASIVAEYEVGGFVIGLPVNMDGSEGPRAQSIRDFAAEMANFFFCHPERVAEGSHVAEGDSSVVSLLRNDNQETWIALWDERLSTVSVEGVVDNLVEKRKTKTNAKSSGLIDKLAAQVILQGALDFISKD